MGIFLIAFVNFVGAYIPSLMVDKYSKDKVWVIEVFPNNNQEGKVFADMIRENNLAIITYKGFNSNKEPVICSKVYSESKEQSKLIISMIPDTFSYHIQEIKNKIGGL